MTVVRNDEENRYVKTSAALITPLLGLSAFVHQLAR